MPHRSVWNSPNASCEAAPQRPAARLAALEKARAAAQEAGAPADALQALDREVASIRAEAANSRPLGARLDSAKSKLAKAESKVTAAEERFKAAMLQVEEARAQRAAAEAVLMELKAELPQESCTASEGLLRCTKDLLQRLETGRFASSVPVPADIIEAMTAVHKAIGIIEPARPVAVEEALEPEDGSTASQKLTSEEQCEEEQPSEDLVMETLDTADDSDEDALLAIARRLKRSRRS